MNIRAIVNSVYRKHRNRPERRQLFFGGSGSGKSVFLNQKCITEVMNGRNWLCCRNVGRTLKTSIFNQLKQTIRSMGVSDFFTINKTDMTFTCNLNGKQAILKGLDVIEKLHSIIPEVGPIDTIWIEEATETTRDKYKLLEKRLRGISEGKKHIIFSFNPIVKTHWIFTEFFDGWKDDSKVLEKDEVFILKTTYKDNEFLTADDIKALEDEKDKYFYDVYTLGNWGVLGAVIFKDKWSTADLTALIPTFRGEENGLDFGYVHPAHFVRSHYSEVENIIYVYDEFFGKYLTNDLLAEEISPKLGRQPVTCDSAEPKSIDELINYNIFALPAKKGPDSVGHGIQWLRQKNIIVHYECQGIINNFNQYKWKEDKNGVALPVPVKRFDDGIDALRYAQEDNMLRTKGFRNIDYSGFLKVPEKAGGVAW